MTCASLLFALASGWIWLRTAYEGFWVEVSPGGHLDLLMMVRSYGVELNLNTNAANKIKRVGGRSEPWGVRYEVIDGVESRQEYGHADSFFAVNDFGFGYETGQAEQPFDPGDVRDALSAKEEADWREFRAYPSRKIVQRQLVIPFWLLMVLPLLPTVMPAMKGVRRRRRAGRGMCAQCGYDLRSSAERCPECGREFSSASMPSPQKPLRGRIAITGGCAATIVVLLFAAERLTRPSTGLRGAAPLQTWQLPLRPEWLAAEGSGAARMQRDQAYGHPLMTRWHQSIWRHDGEENVVVFVSYGDGRWNNAFDVFVFDRRLDRVVRWGQMTGSSREAPYRLVEILSDDPSLPEPYRNRWSLAAQTATLDPTGNFASPSTPPADEGLAVQIVEWTDGPRNPLANVLARGLSAPERFEMRPAEPRDQDEGFTDRSKAVFSGSWTTLPRLTRIRR